MRKCFAEILVFELAKTDLICFSIYSDHCQVHVNEECFRRLMKDQKVWRHQHIPNHVHFTAGVLQFTAIFENGLDWVTFDNEVTF